MDSGDTIQLITLLILILLSAFFSSAETSLTMVNKIRMKSLADEGSHKAKTVLKIIEDSGKMLSAILIGNNIVNLTASSIATALSLKLWGSVGAGIATGVLTVIILVFSEISPKTLATIYAEKLALLYAGTIYNFMRLFTPVIFIINKLSLGLLFLLRIDASAKNSAMTENELRTIVGVSHEDGVIESEECEMIYNVVDFGDSQAKDVMVPRIDMTFVNIDNSYEELIQIFRADKFTRYPVYQDTTDNVVGIINIKDLLLLNTGEKFDMRSLLREPYFTYEYKNTSELLIEMRETSINIAIVLDEYGATAGLITLEDLLEEIVGEIRDEYDEDEVDAIQQIREHEYLVDGSAKLDDLNNMLGISLASEEYESIAGYIIEYRENLPKEGESFTTEEGIRITIKSMDKNRIHKIYMTVPQRPEEEKEEG